MDHLIFEPLKLRNTGHEIEGQIIPNMASGYNVMDEELFKSSHENKSHVFAAGSMYSTAHDLLLFAKEISRGSLISNETHKLYLGPNNNNDISSGWISWTYSSKLNTQMLSDKKLDNEVQISNDHGMSRTVGTTAGQVLWHGGSCPGYRSTISLFLDDNIVVIGLSNKVPINVSLIHNKLGNIALGLEPEELFKPHLSKLTKDIVNGKFTTALAKYEQLLKGNPNNEKLKVGELNTLGYLYLEYDKTQEAINIFKFATILFPKNANAFDSLGEALIRDGKHSEAVKMYEKSLTLNPKNENAKAVIKQFENH